MSLRYLRFLRIRYFGCSPRSRQICAVEMLPSPPIKAAMFPPPLTPLPTGQGTRHAGEKRETPKMPDFFPPEGRTCPAMSLLGDLRGALVDYDGLCRSRRGWCGALMGAWLKTVRDPLLAYFVRVVHQPSLSLTVSASAWRILCGWCDDFAVFFHGGSCELGRKCTQSVGVVVVCRMACTTQFPLRFRCGDASENSIALQEECLTRDFLSTACC